jgi:hypothetical protein
VASRVFVVVDMRGAGRVLGVFERAAEATELVGRYPHYYKLFEHELGRLNPEVLAWTEDAEERALLVRLFGEGS